MTWQNNYFRRIDLFTHNIHTNTYPPTPSNMPVLAYFRHEHYESKNEELN